MVASMPGCLFDQSWQPLHNTGAVTLDQSEVAMKKEFVYNILSLTLKFRKCCSREAREGFPKEALCSVMMSVSFSATGVKEKKNKYAYVYG